MVFGVPIHKSMMVLTDLSIPKRSHSTPILVVHLLNLLKNIFNLPERFGGFRKKWGYVGYHHPIQKFYGRIFHEINPASLGIQGPPSAPTVGATATLPAWGYTWAKRSPDTGGRPRMNYHLPTLTCISIYIYIYMIYIYIYIYIYMQHIYIYSLYP